MSGLTRGIIYSLPVALLSWGVLILTVWWLL